MSSGSTTRSDSYRPSSEPRRLPLLNTRGCRFVRAGAVVALYIENLWRGGWRSSESLILRPGPLNPFHGQRFRLYPTSHAARLTPT